MDQKFILVTMLVKLGASAAISAALVRSWEFRSRLFHEEGRTHRETAILTLAIAIPYGLGVQVRHMVANFKAGDLAFEGTVIMGVIGGVYAGVLGGALVAIPAVIHGEYMTLPFNMVVGLIAGTLRDLADQWADKENIWSFSPFIDLTVFRWIKRNIPKPRMDWQIAFFVVILLMQFARMELGLLFPNELFSITSRDPWVFGAICLTTVMCVAIPLKIWNGTRSELKLEEQTRMLLQARLDALQSQINPHFLFNTLNSVSSLVRVEPDTAREVILKLATILRRLLHSSDAFVPLQDEIDFIDNYLDIEVVRFGRDKLRVVKELDPASLDVMVPSMLLQPLVENSIKHGLSSKIEGGSIYLRSQIAKDHLNIEVEDDGVGMASVQLLERPTGLGQGGIGIANVAERLKVLYGDTARMTIDSRNGTGTLVRLRLPVLPGEVSVSVQRPSTRR